MTSTSTNAPVGRRTWDIQGCSIQRLSINLRILFDPTQDLASFRLRVTINTSPSALLRYVYLDISPDRIHDLSLRIGSSTCLHFSVAAIAVIVPQGLELHSITDADRTTLDTLRSLVQQDALVVSLPDRTEDLPHLAAMCEAVARGGFRPDPGQMDLKTLYRGQGGRVVEADDELWVSTNSSPMGEPLGVPGTNSFAPDFFFSAPRDKTPPPTYGSVISPPPAPPLTPVHYGKERKRLRTRTPSISPDSSPDYRTWKHLELAVGEREKIIVELLRRADSQEKAFQKVIGDLDAKCARAQEVIAELSELSSGAVKQVNVLQEAGSSLAAPKKQREEARNSQRSTASPSPSVAASPGSVSSMSSNIPERVQAYITAQLDRLRDELAEDYATNESVEQYVGDEVDRMLNRYVEEHQVVEMIQEAVDDAMAKVRERILGSWE